MLLLSERLRSYITYGRERLEPSIIMDVACDIGGAKVIYIYIDLVGPRLRSIQDRKRADTCQNTFECIPLHYLCH